MRKGRDDGRRRREPPSTPSSPFSSGTGREPPLRGSPRSVRSFASGRRRRPSVGHRRCDPANRCIRDRRAGTAVPASSRTLVCLAAAHVNCPRYLRGMVLVDVPPAPAPREPISPAIIGAALVLLAVDRGVVRLPGGPRRLRPGGRLDPAVPGCARGDAHPRRAVAQSVELRRGLDRRAVRRPGAELQPERRPDASPDARADPGADASTDREAGPDERPVRAPDAMSGDGRTAGSTRSGPATTSRASPTSSASRTTGSIDMNPNLRTTDPRRRQAADPDAHPLSLSGAD